MDTIPVRVYEKDGEVNVLPLVRLPNGYALHERAKYIQLGHVTLRPARVYFELKRDEWGWVAQGSHGSAQTKKDAIAHMLEAFGFEQVSLDETVPSLF